MRAPRGKSQSATFGDDCPLPTIQVCGACRDAGKELECTHMRATLPKWKSQAKAKRLAGVYVNDPHLQKREQLGVMADADIKAFIGEDVEALLVNEARNTKGGHVKCVATGKPKKKFLVFSLFFLFFVFFVFLAAIY